MPERVKPTPRHAETVLAGALAEVNAIRAARHLPAIDAFPRGARRNAMACPLSLAIGGSVWAGEYILRGERTHRPLPPMAREFVLLFDVGAYPELVERPSKVA